MLRSAFPGVVRGDIWLVAFDLTIGSEIQKTRPCLIVSPPELHDHLRTVLAAPMTISSRVVPFRVPVAFDGKTGLILLDQIRAIDKQCLVRRLGSIDKVTLSLCLARLQKVFAE